MSHQQLGLRPPLVRAPLPDGPQDVAQILEKWIRDRPTAVALVDRHRRLNFRDLEAEVNAAAGFLEWLGVQCGDRVAATTANTADLVIAFLAVQRLGAIWVGINRKLAPPEKQYLIDDADARVILADEDSSSPLGGRNGIVVRMESVHADSDWSNGLKQFVGRPCRPRTIDPWAPAAIAYTSGTTGRPKGVVHSQHSIVLAATIAALNSGRFDADVIRATATPLTILNLMILGPICAFITGARHICMDRVDAAGVTDWIRREGVNTLSLPPPTVRDLVSMSDFPADNLATVQWMVVGGGSVPIDLLGRFKARFGRSLTIGYGQTECPTGMSMTWDDSPVRPACVGRAHRHLRLSIQNEACVELPAGESGEICYRAVDHGPWAHAYSGPLGYWRKPEATEALWRGGWIHSGDIGYLDAAGNLFIQDRRSDVIIRGGANVYPAEVERILRMHEKVRDCAVIGIPNTRLGQIVGVAIEVPIGHTNEGLVDELYRSCLQGLARYKIPVRWLLLPGLPRNAMGKVLKTNLITQLSELVDYVPAQAENYEP